MAALTDAQIAGHAHAAGFRGDALVKIIAIILGESGGRPDARGDTGLVTGTWGPSIGLAQIRSLNAERGTGGVRDELANLDPATNLRHAWTISGGGTNFGPWTVYTKGTWRQFLDRATAAAAAPAQSGSQGLQGVWAPTPAIPGLPGLDDAQGAIVEALGGMVDPFLDGLRRLSVIGIAVIAGVGLVIVGAWRGVRA